MHPFPALRRLALVVTVVSVFAALALHVGPRTDSAPAPARPTYATAQFGTGPGRNLVNEGDRNVPTDWDVTPGRRKNIKWSAQLGTRASVWGPVVHGGKVFVGTNNERPRNNAIRGDKSVLMCFRAGDGTFLWQSVHDKLPAGRVNDWEKLGICSTPAAEGKRLWYVSNRGEVICASTEGLAAGNLGVKDEQYRGKTDADIIWRLDMIKQLNVFPHNQSTCAPLLVGGRLFVITGNGVDESHTRLPYPDAPSFLCLDKGTGKVLWSSKLPGKNILHGQWSNPAYAVVRGTPQVLFPGGDGWLYALDPKDGKLLWKFDCNPKASTYRGEGGSKNPIVATPVVHDNRAYVGVGDDPRHDPNVGHLWCIDLVRATVRGKLNKERDVSPVKDNFDPKAEVNRHSALAWHHGGPAPPGGGRRWLFARTLSTCAVHDGLCYAADFDGVLACLDARTGKKYWEHNLGARTWSSPYWVGGHVYVGNEAGNVHVFAHGKTRKLVRRISMGTGVQVRATPVAAGGVLYVVTDNPARLYAIARR
jgi:outer membrane protein assembly factor BamB